MPNWWLKCCKILCALLNCSTKSTAAGYRNVSCNRKKKNTEGSPARSWQMCFAEQNNEVQTLTDKLGRAGRKLHRSKTRPGSKSSRPYQGELSAAAEMLQRWQQHANKCAHKRTRLEIKYEWLKKAHRQPPSHSSTCTSVCLWMRPWVNPPDIDITALGIITMHLAFMYL